MGSKAHPQSTQQDHENAYPTVITEAVIERRAKHDVILKVMKAGDGSVLVDLRSWGVRANGGRWPESGVRLQWKTFADVVKAIHEEYSKEPSNIEKKIVVPGCKWVVRFHGDVITDPGPGPTQESGSSYHIHIDTPAEPLWISPIGLYYLLECGKLLYSVLGDEYINYLQGESKGKPAAGSELSSERKKQVEKEQAKKFVETVEEGMSLPVTAAAVEFIKNEMKRKAKPTEVVEYPLKAVKNELESIATTTAEFLAAAKKGRA